MEGWFDIGDKVLSLLNENKREEAQEVVLEECTPALNKAVELVKPLNEETDQIRTKTMTESMDRTNKPFVYADVHDSGSNCNRNVDLLESDKSNCEAGYRGC